MFRIYKPSGKYEILNLEPSGSYGEMYIHDNATPQTLTTINEWYKVVDTWVAGYCSGFTADTANSQLICTVSGIYQLTCQLNYNGGNIDAYEFTIFVNGVQNSTITAHSDARQLSQTISTPLMGLLSLNKNDIIDLRARCTSNSGTSITVVHVNLNMELTFGV